MKQYILPLRDMVFQPGLTVPIYMDNPVSIQVLETAAKEQKSVVLAAQKVWNYPTAPEDLHKIGTRADILQLLRLPDGTLHVMLQTRAPVDISNIALENGLFVGDTADIEQVDDSSDYTSALRDKVAENLRFLAKTKRVNMSKLQTIINSYSLAAFIDAVIQMTDIEVEAANKILRMRAFSEKLMALLEQVTLMTEMAKIDENINKRVNQQMESGRREIYLAEKMKALQREMGEDGGEGMDAKSLHDKITETKMPKEAEEKALNEWKRMSNMSPMSAEGAVLKTYLDELLSLPWNKSDKSEIDLGAARAILDKDHTGMVGVKERILEHLAVMKKTGNSRGSILCLVGAPGVGKTSLGRSVAAALGRKYQRISLGGISDEAHFRGHRKTYIGSQPGRIMDALKRSGANNPVIVLDEIDKIGRDWRGDPEAALLEVLDPEQNKTFRDHYLEVDFDLSNVMFIATANTINFSQALKDRMEIIEIPGYTEDEKVAIARDHLIARAAADTGWHFENINIGDDALRHIIRNYTAEQGVRELQREITAVLRRSLLQHDGEDCATEFTRDKIDALLSVRKTGGISHKIGFNATARV